jgi:aerobic-type carbon monoxide dehydrogenase small subunit (CoxS/CutS family)
MSEEKQKTPKTISRREFLKDAGIVVGGTAVGSAFFLSACGKEVEVTKTVTDTVTKYVCPVCSQEFSSLDALKTHFDEAHEEGAVAENAINITVNGDEYSFAVQPNCTLRDLLRNKLGLTSIKDMCGGYGACGSCSVIVDGRPVLSCLVLAIDCDGANIETTEGISDNNHPLIESYIKHYCAQCGYCIPGFIVTAKALLDTNHNPSEEDIMQAFAGNICRCGTYPVHIPAVLEAAGELSKGG